MNPEQNLFSINMICTHFKLTLSHFITLHLRPMKTIQNGDQTKRFDPDEISPYDLPTSVPPRDALAHK